MRREKKERLLYESGVPIAKKLAGFYSRACNVSFDDFYGAALEGLAQSIKKNSEDKSNGAKFTTFAYKRIKGNILNELRKTSQVPYRIQNLYFKGNSLQKKFNLSDEEVADKLNITLEQWVNCSKAMHYYHYRLLSYQASYVDEWKDETYRLVSIPPLFELLKCFGFDENLSHRNPQWKKKLDDKTIFKILEYRNKGYSCKKIGEFVDRHEETIRRVLSLHSLSGVEIIAKSRRLKTKEYLTVIEEIRLAKELTKTETAKQIGIHRSNLYQWIKGGYMTINSQVKVEQWIAENRI